MKLVRLGVSILLSSLGLVAFSVQSNLPVQHSLILMVGVWGPCLTAPTRNIVGCGIWGWVIQQEIFALKILKNVMFCFLMSNFKGRKQTFVVLWLDSLLHIQYLSSVS